MDDLKTYFEHKKIHTNVADVCTVKHNEGVETSFIQQSKRNSASLRFSEFRKSKEYK